MGKRKIEKTKNIKLTWQTVKSRYPEIVIGLRRYFYKLIYLVQQPREIPPELWETEVIKTLTKDFSGKVRRALARKLLGVLRRRKQFKKTGKFPARR